MKSDAFRAAAEAKDFEAAEGLFREDVVFRSPFVFRPYEGLDALRFILTNVAEIFENFRYIGQTETDDFAVLMFEASVGDRQLQGVDIFRFDENGLIGEMTVMVRPMSGLQAVSDQMKLRLEALGVEPA
jgi:hypothetical protein